MKSVTDECTVSGESSWLRGEKLESVSDALPTVRLAYIPRVVVWLVVSRVHGGGEHAPTDASWPRFNQPESPLESRTRTRLTRTDCRSGVALVFTTGRSDLTEPRYL